MPLSQKRRIHPSMKRAYSWFWKKMDEAGLSLRKLAMAAEDIGETISPTTVVHWFRSKQGEDPVTPSEDNILLLARIFQSRGLDVTTEDIRWEFGLSEIPPVSTVDRMLLSRLRYIAQHEPELADKLREGIETEAQEVERRRREAGDEAHPKQVGGLNLGLSS
jgi:hypothetical protein